MVYRLLPCLCLVVFLVGFQDVRADDSCVYEAPGCPQFSLPGGFQYVGTPEMGWTTYCTGNNCNPLWQGPGRKSRYDLFVNAPADEAPREMCLFIRFELVGRRHHWAPLDGRQIRIDGRYYHEGFGVYRHDKEHLFTPVENYLVEKGYPAANPGYISYVVQRNVNVETRLTVIYARNIRAIPKDLFKDGKALEEYMRTTFAERVVPL